MGFILIVRLLRLPISSYSSLRHNNGVNRHSNHVWACPPLIWWEGLSWPLRVLWVIFVSRIWFAHDFEIIKFDHFGWGLYHALEALVSILSGWKVSRTTINARLNVRNNQTHRQRTTTRSHTGDNRRLNSFCLPYPLYICKVATY